MRKAWHNGLPESQTGFLRAFRLRLISRLRATGVPADVFITAVPLSTSPLQVLEFCRIDPATNTLLGRPFFVPNTQSTDPNRRSLITVFALNLFPFFSGFGWADNADIKTFGEDISADLIFETCYFCYWQEPIVQLSLNSYREGSFYRHRHAMRVFHVSFTFENDEVLVPSWFDGEPA